MRVQLVFTTRRILIAGITCLSCLMATPVISTPVSSTEDWERREILVDASELPDIELVLDKGRWSNDGFTGELKYLLSKEPNGANKIFIQWLSDEDGSVAYTVSVREFNIAPEYKLELPECLSDDCTLSKIKATHVYEDVSQTFVLNLVGLGRYSVGLFEQ